jgi:aromatic amino acid aminotransferase I
MLGTPMRELFMFIAALTSLLTDFRWFITLSTLCNPGEGYFTEEFTYPSAPATSVPLGVKPVAVKLDAQGMRADDLRKVIEEWDVDARGGMKR